MSPKKRTYETAGGIEITRHSEAIELPGALDAVLERIDATPGVILASGYEFPGRYSRWDLAFVAPPVELTACGRHFTLRALNERGRVILGILAPTVETLDAIERVEIGEERIEGTIKQPEGFFLEEERSKQPSIFSLIRALIAALKSDVDPHLGLYGAFGYDLVLQFEPLRLTHPRPENLHDLHLFLPDELVVVDHQRERAFRHRYDFACGDRSTGGVPRPEIAAAPPAPEPPPTDDLAKLVRSDHEPHEYARGVEAVREGCIRGDFFEVVLSQTFSLPYEGSPTALFERIRTRNPSPYEFHINLGSEALVGASPEMFVRVEGTRVETCPIAGTIARGGSPVEDAAAIQTLLTSEKDESELTMCTDVDRNDKSRVCKPGTVQLVGRRLIETYSRLFHTVDHVIGELRDDCDGLDALLSHMWACTLTGAPKPDAMQFIEDLEKSPRRYYGGCVGRLTFNGDVNTGIAIRTIHLHDGRADLRVGATLLADSEPEAEEIETRTKAAAFLDALLGAPAPDITSAADSPTRLPAFDLRTGRGKRVLFVDNRDSFVHTLANYVRQTGAEVLTLRTGFPLEMIDEYAPDLVFISPGPGTPADLGVPPLVTYCAEREIPTFGVCLGLQGMVEAFGGELTLLPYPMHGKPSPICLTGETGAAHLFDGFPREFTAGRYHSICAVPTRVPDCLAVTARTPDGTVMAVEHKRLPVAAVQFHPESILSLKDDLGLRLIANVLATLPRQSAGGAARVKAKAAP